MIQSFFNREIIVASWPIVLAGLRNTVLLSMLVVPLGLIGGLIVALLASVKNPVVRWPSWCGSISSACFRRSCC